MVKAFSPSLAIYWSQTLPERKCTGALFYQPPKATDLSQAAWSEYVSEWAAASTVDIKSIFKGWSMVYILEGFAEEKKKIKRNIRPRKS
jgi:hypothetical protein